MPTFDTTLTPDAAAEVCLEAARRIAPHARELSPQIEREGHLPADLVQEIRDAGLLHMLLPRDLGGMEVDPVGYARVVETLSAADGSTGWCVMLAGQGTAFAGMMPAEQSLKLWGNGGVISGTANPVGRAVWTETPEPGYIVSGRWSFASGSSHADWFMGECKVYDGEEQRRDDNANEVTRVLFVPRDKVTIYQTWNTTGLRGTASNDFSIENAFVPADLGFQMLVTQPVHPWALYRSAPLIFIGHGAQSLGLARGAIESAIEIARKKRGWGGVQLTGVSRVQVALAQATALVDSAADYLYGTSQRLWDQALAGGDIAPILSAKARLANSNATTASVQAVDILHNAMGTASIFAENPIERQFRDIHTAAKHVMIGHMTYEAAGRVLLGMEPQFPFF